MIKIARFAFIIIFISGCSRFAYSDLTTQIYDLVVGYEYKGIDKSQYTEEKYSFAIAQVGNTAPVKLVLASVDNNIFKWISADKITIYTKNGIIIKTNGLINDFSSEQITKNTTSFSPSKHYITFHNPELSSFQRYDRYEFLETKEDYQLFKGEFINVDVYEYATEAPMIKWSEKNLLLTQSNTSQVIAIEQKFHPHHPPLKLFYYLK